MRVLIIPGYYGFGARSANQNNARGVFFRDQALALARTGHDVSVMFVHFDAATRTDVEVIYDGALRSVYIHARPWRKFNSIQRLLVMINAYNRVFQWDRPDVIHAHMFYALPPALFLSRIFRIPYVVTEHSSGVRRGTLKEAWRLLARIGYARASAVLAVSDPLARSMSRYTPREIRVVPNLVRDEFFLTDVDEQRPAEGPFRFISIGYCSRIKGWDVLLRSFAPLAAERPDVELVLCGGECADLQELANELKIGERVRFTGKVPPAEVPLLLASSHCHVMPSRVETFGIASVEALACGKPIIMTDTDAADRIVTPDNGLRVPVEDVPSLTLAMRDMAINSERYDARKIRQTCWESYSGPSVSATLTDVYSQAIRRRTPRKAGITILERLRRISRRTEPGVRTTPSGTNIEANGS